MARNGSVWLTRSYHIVDRDPEIERFRTLFEKEPLTRNSELAVLAGVSAQTVNNMFGGKTRRPLHSTFAKMAGAMGFAYGLQRQEEPDYARELPNARAEFKAYKDMLAKKKGKTTKKRRK